MGYDLVIKVVVVVYCTRLLVESIIVTIIKQVINPKSPNFICSVFPTVDKDVGGGGGILFLQYLNNPVSSGYRSP